MSVETGGGAHGTHVAYQAQNLTFDGLSGPVTTDLGGQLVMYFSVWDYDLDKGAFTVVGEMLQGSDSLQFGASIDWPAGRPVPADTCEFKVCEGRLMAPTGNTFHYMYLHSLVSLTPSAFV